MIKRFLRKLRPAHKSHEERARKEKRDRVAPNSRTNYVDYVASLSAKHDAATAMSLAVGGDYEVMGDALLTRLTRFGLKETDYLIDVGCGSGRLAFALARSGFANKIRYLGIDVVPSLLDFAREKCHQPSWRFEVVEDLRIPETDSRADVVCFFSVFTHLMQEESFIYLSEARRVLKPGGLIVATYLDIADAKQWDLFEANAQSARRRQNKPMDIFLAADFMRVWATKLDLEMLEGNAPDCGQRTCILRKR